MNEKKTAKSLKKIAYNIEKLDPTVANQFFEYLLNNCEHICDLCAKFSGNIGIPRSSEFGLCLNKESIYYNRQTHEKASCDKWIK